MTLDASTGAISSALIGGQGTYSPEIIVTDRPARRRRADQLRHQRQQRISGEHLSVELRSFIIAWMRRQRTCPWILRPRRRCTAAICRRRSSHFSEAIRTRHFPNGIPAIEVPYNQPDVSVSTTVYQSYFTPGPIPAYAPVEGTSNSTGDRHVLVYLEAGGGNNPALYEMWQGIYQDGPVDRFLERAVWPNVASNALTPQGQGTSDAAGLAGGAAAGERRRGDRNGHAERAERNGSASDSIHAESHAELLGVAGH